MTGGQVHDSQVVEEVSSTANPRRAVSADKAYESQRARQQIKDEGALPVIASQATSLLIRWSIQEIRRIALKLAQRKIQPARVIACSLWRRAHHAEARRAHLKKKKQP